MSEYFPKPKSFGERVKFKLDLYNYTMKAEFKKAKQVLTYENLLERLI